jgi:predicted amidohydrolase
MTALEIAAYSMLWTMGALNVTIAILALINCLLSGPQRDRRDDNRVLLAYANAWDLTDSEINKTTRLSIARTYFAILRLKRRGFLGSSWIGGIRGYTLTDLGREAVYDLERSKINEIHNDRHGA